MAKLVLWSLLALAALLLAVEAHPEVHMPAEDEEISDAFDSFVSKWNKQYVSDSHKAQKFEVFKSNLKRIDYLNKNDPTGVYGITQWADMKDEEIGDKMHGSFPEGADIKDWTHSESMLEPDFDFEQEEDYAHPPAWDWRKFGAVSHVKNQLHCGACWAFSILGNIEGMMKLRGHKIVSLSEQNLLDCDRDQHGCHGGVPAKGYHWVKNNLGVDLEKNYLYHGKRKNCKFRNRGPAVKVPIKGWVQVPKSEDKIAKYLHKHGPLAIALHGRGWLHFYHGGIAQPPHCPMKITHGVVLVGYGEENGKKYWIIKNSWGPLFGESGFFRLLRGKNLCNIHHLVNSAVMEELPKDGVMSDMYLNEEDYERQRQGQDEDHEGWSGWSYD